MEYQKDLEIVNLEYKKKNFINAKKVCKEILVKYPDKTYLYNLYGLILQKLGDYKESIFYFKKALEIDSHLIYTKHNLANSYKNLFKYHLAEKLYLEVLAEKNDYQKCWYNYALLKQILNDYSNSIRFFQKSLEFEPNHVGSLFGLATCYQHLGEKNKSLEVTDKILKINPKLTGVYRLISSMTSYKTDSNLISRIEELLENGTLENWQKADLYFSLSKGFDDLGDYKKSFEYCQKGNMLKRSDLEYNISKDKKLFSSIKKCFENFEFNKLSKSKHEIKIIFIVGLPRSGTSLAEQILSSHKNIHGLGELIYIRKLIFENIVTKNEINKKLFLNSLKERKITERYFNIISNYKLQKNVIIDKAPLNFIWLGFIKVFFPNSKIIHCTRNIYDTSLSIYKNMFEANHLGWSFTEEEIAYFIKMYSDLMNFWKNKIGNNIYELNYENIIKDKKNEIIKLINFCDEEMDDACFNHKNNKAPIKTLSSFQARKDLYVSSINKSKYYKDSLKKLFKILGQN